MSQGQLHVVVRHLRRLVGEGSAEPTDRQLLARFAAGRDEAAFAALVERHGPLVWGVCRRVLHDPHLAEDAFQATFLVLVRRAGSIRKHGSVGSWLHGVAYRVAVKARTRAHVTRAPPSFPRRRRHGWPPDAVRLRNQHEEKKRRRFFFSSSPLLFNSRSERSRRSRLVPL